MIAFYICSGAIIGWSIGMLFCALKVDRILRRFGKHE